MKASACPNGRMWDAFVLGLPGVDVSAQTAHLETCHDCQVLVADRQAYYAELVRLASESPVDAKPRSFPGPIRLQPMNLIEPPSRTESVMAAAGPDHAAVPLASTFASDDRRWMVKVVWDSTTGHEKLYLLSNDGLPVSGLLVRLSGLTGEYLTDARGSVDLGPVRWPVGKDPQVTVVSPAATFTLNSEFLPDHDQSATLLRSPQDDILRVSMTRTEATHRLLLEIVSLAPDLAGKPVRVAVRSAGGDLVLPLEPVMVLEHFELPGTLEIYLFP